MGEDGEEVILEEARAQIDDVINQRLESAFLQTPQFLLHNISKIAAEYDPIDLAHAAYRLPPAARIVLYENLADLPAKIIFMINTGSSTRAAIFRQLGDREIKELIEQTPPDEAVWMLDDMSDRRLRRIFAILHPKKAERIRELQKHERHSAGRLMTDEFFAFPLATTIGEVAKTIRNNPGIDLTRRIFVLNDDKELCGYVAARNLIISPDYIPVKQVMKPILHRVAPETPRDEVLDLVERYKIPALPVTDKEDLIIGVITYEDVVEAMEDMADETIATIAGTAENVSEHDPIIKRFFSRAPWLLVTVCSGLVTASAMTHFLGQTWFAFVPVFVPLITGMSGNVGIQCSTILVRGMATGELTARGRRDAVINEFLISSMSGACFGAICGFVVILLNQFGVHNLGDELPVVVSYVTFGVMGACYTSTSIATFSPFIFERLGIDAAVAAGPIVTAFNDVLSTLMFFLIAFSIVSVFG